MMVTYVRGAFKNVHGTLEFDPESPRLSSVQATIEAAGIWTGQPQRDAHLRSPDFLDVEKSPHITFKGDQVALSTHSFQAPGFYARFGYQECGRTPAYPRGYHQIHLVKQLQ